jgi:hypothetical protein
MSAILRKKLTSEDVFGGRIIGKKEEKRPTLQLKCLIEQP